jgi:hypothetical protein
MLLCVFFDVCRAVNSPGHIQRALPPLKDRVLNEYRKYVIEPSPTYAESHDFNPSNGRVSSNDSTTDILCRQILQGGCIRFQLLLLSVQDTSALLELVTSLLHKGTLCIRIPFKLYPLYLKVIKMDCLNKCFQFECEL